MKNINHLGLEDSADESFQGENDISTFVKGSTKKSGCMAEAYRLKALNKKGDVYWVTQINGMMIGHAYYIPDPNQSESYALNQADNGYEGFPELTTAQVLKYGIRLQVSEDFFSGK